MLAAEPATAVCGRIAPARLFVAFAAIGLREMSSGEACYRPAGAESVAFIARSWLTKRCGAHAILLALALSCRRPSINPAFVCATLAAEKLASLHGRGDLSKLLKAGGVSKGLGGSLDRSRAETRHDEVSG